MDFVPICQYCGQVATTNQVFQSQEVANAWASCNCDCTDGKILRKRLNRAAEIHNAIDGLFEGDETVAPAQYIETLYKIGDAIRDGYFSSQKSPLWERVRSISVSIPRARSKLIDL